MRGAGREGKARKGIQGHALKFTTIEDIDQFLLASLGCPKTAHTKDTWRSRLMNQFSSVASQVGSVKFTPLLVCILHV